jgi:thiamine pyrophosphate-dependent acetolactate synthase large subunit-like protein
MSATFGTLDRREAVKVLLADRGDLLVVTGLGSPSYDVFAAGENDGNFYLWGAMGGAAMMGLGLALAQPQRPVAVITGDGEQLMGLGSLFTVGVSKPPNLTIAVLDNGHFGETGMQLSHSGLGARLEVVAQGAGFASVTEISDLDGIKAFRGKMQSISDGPRFARIRIAPGNPVRALPPRDGVFLKESVSAASRVCGDLSRGASDTVRLV